MELMLVLLQLLLLTPSVLPATSSPRSFRLDVAHVDATAANLTDTELLRRAIQRSRDRLASILNQETTVAKAVSAETPVWPAGGEYVVKLGIGTPQRCFTAVIDTASDLIWTQCQPSASSYLPPGHAFFPSLSSSFAEVPCRSETCRLIQDTRCRNGTCRYTYRYNGNATSEGLLAMEKLTVGDDAYHDIIFGCSNASYGWTQASGVLGLGRGPLSLVSQLPVRKFLYCLPPAVSRVAGKLVLGSGADVDDDSPEPVTVPLYRNPTYPSFYYLNLNGLAVGDKSSSVENFTAAVEAGGAGGMIVDIASTITFLERSVYDELVFDLMEEIDLPRGDGSDLGLDLCFLLPEGISMDRVYVPPVSLAFDGTWLELDKDRLFVEDQAQAMMCLMMDRTPGVSILGNFQQQQMQVRYNLRRKRLTFVKNACDSVA